MKQPRRLISWLVVLSLPLLLSHCGKKETLGFRSLTPTEAAKMAQAYDTWDAQKRPSKLLRQGLPPDRLEAMGDISLQAGNYENSLINYLGILQQNPERHDLRYKVGVIFLLTGQLEAARQELAQVLVHRPEMLEAHEALGLVHLEEKQYPLAIGEFQTVLAKDPRRANTQYLLGVTFLEAGQTDQAIFQLKRAAELNPRHVSTCAALGQAYLKSKDYSQAVTWLKKGQALAPDNQKVNYQLGMALAGQKKYSEALEAFLKAGDEAQAYNNIGVHYFTEGKYEEAAKCFQRAIELRPIFYGEAKANLQKALEKIHEAGNDAS
jgi:tetratricopeptide (TPR) repeat protein